MPSIPWTQILMILLVDAVLALGVSIFLGCLAASALGRSLRTGVLVGLVVPYLGPLVWLLQAARSAPLSGPASGGGHTRARWAFGGVLAAAAVGYLVAAVLPWASVEGDVEGSTASESASAMDSVVGAAALVMSSIVLISCAVILMRGASRVAAAVTGMVSGCWLAITIDSLLLYSGANSVVSTVEGLDGGRATADLAAGSGALIVLGVSLISLVTSLLLGALEARGAASPDAMAAPATLATDFGYGDGF